MFAFFKNGSNKSYKSNSSVRWVVFKEISEIRLSIFEWKYQTKNQVIRNPFEPSTRYAFCPLSVESMRITARTSRREEGAKEEEKKENKIKREIKICEKEDKMGNIRTKKELEE